MTRTRHPAALPLWLLLVAAVVALFLIGRPQEVFAPSLQPLRWTAPVPASAPESHSKPASSNSSQSATQEAPSPATRPLPAPQPAESGPRLIDPDKQPSVCIVPADRAVVPECGGSK